MHLLYQFKNLTILFVFAVFLFSFNNEATDILDADNIENNDKIDSIKDNDNVLVTKIDVAFKDDPDSNFSLNYDYDGKRITRVTYSIGGKEVCSYNDKNQLIKHTAYSQDNAIDIIENYTYDNQGRLATITTNEGDKEPKPDYLTYNSDNTIIKYNDQSGNNQLTMTLINENVTEINYGDGYVDKYSYGDKNGPFKNLENREALSRLDTGVRNAYEYALNNILSFDETYTDSNTKKEEIETTSYTYTFTNLGYPRTRTETYEGEVLTTFTYTYNTD